MKVGCDEQLVVKIVDQMLSHHPSPIWLIRLGHLQLSSTRRQSRRILSVINLNLYIEVVVFSDLL